MSQPALQVGRVPAGHQARPLQGQQLGRGLRAGRHHRVEVKPQGGRVSVRPLVLPGEGGADQRLAARAPGRLCSGKFDSTLAPRLLRILLLLTPGHAPGRPRLPPCRLPVPVWASSLLAAHGDRVLHGAALPPTWYQEYARSEGSMRMVMILALGTRDAALFGASSEWK